MKVVIKEIKLQCVCFAELLFLLCCYLVCMHVISCALATQSDEDMSVRGNQNIDSSVGVVFELGFFSFHQQNIAWEFIIWLKNSKYT